MTISDPHVPSRRNARTDRLASPIGYWDRELRNVRANAAHRDVFGLAPEQLTGMSLREMLGDRLFAQTRDHLAAALGGQARTFECTVNTVAGARQTLGAYIPDLDGGEVCGLHTMFCELPATRVPADRDRDLGESRFRTLFEAAPTATMLLDREGRIAAVNTAGARLLGRSVDELLGMRDLELTHPEDVEESRDRMTALWQDGVTRYQIEKRYVHRDGHSLWTQADGTLIEGKDGAGEYVLKQIQDVTARRDHEMELEYLADHDVLTGMLNRRGLLRELERQAVQAHRYGEGGVLLVVDLDHFKHVNDVLGHTAGDELIVTVAQLIDSRVRESDVVARLGGDEFAVILPRADVETGERVADEIIELVRERLSGGADHALPVTASVGVARFTTQASAEDVLAAADLAMYDAKEGGRDRTATYAEGGRRPSGVEARINWLTRVRGALVDDGLRVVAQPILDRRDESVAMFELLVRLADADGSLIPPAAFLYVAERFDLVQDIDRYVITEAARVLGRTRDAGRPVRLTVNVSARSVADIGLAAFAGSALARAGADPRDLVFELTESAAVLHVRYARAFAHQVKDLGCRVAIDDFGAGFGSFSYLKSLPFDFLKIDGDFVTGAPGNPTDALIVTTVRDLARGLGGEVIAEYCADEKIVAWLDGEGIALQQGFEHGRPEPIEAVKSLSGA